MSEIVIELIARERTSTHVITKVAEMHIGQHAVFQVSRTHGASA
jgi:hypothetical protein